VPEQFVNGAGAQMTRAGFEYVLDKHARAAAKTCPSLHGRSISPHQLRHGCAVIMLQATHDIRKVALWLGHADIRTTEVYLRMDPSEKLEAIEAVVPPELRRGRFKAPDALIASLRVDASRPPTGRSRARPRVTSAVASGRRATTCLPAVLLDRRAWHGPERAEHAAITGLGAQPGAAALAVVKELAGVRGHRLGRGKAAGRASDPRFQDHRCLTRTGSRS
jgi:Phage integrase family